MEVILGKVSCKSESFRGFGLATDFKISVEEGLRLAFKLAAYSTDSYYASGSVTTCGPDLFVDGGNAISR